MPAMPAMNGQEEQVSWALVSYVRSLRSATPIEAANRQSALNTAQYVGSASCERCHSSVYRRWKSTPMANVVRDPREHPDAIIPDLSTNTIAPFTADQVAFVYGSRWKQRYFTRIGDDYFPQPVQWDIQNKTWRPYHVADTGADWWTAHYPSSNFERPTDRSAMGAIPSTTTSRRRSRRSGMSAARSCHGPGSAHAAQPTRSNIFNVSPADAAASNDMCLQPAAPGQPRGGLY